MLIIPTETLLEWFDALHTQFQLKSEAIVPRKSMDAPNMSQLSAIRDAYNHVGEMVKEVLNSRRESKPQLWQHYKGGIYQFICISIDEDTGLEEVVYQDIVDMKVYHRPRWEFGERFKKIT